MCDLGVKQNGVWTAFIVRNKSKTELLFKIMKYWNLNEVVFLA
jgi:hypothetical protein